MEEINKYNWQVRILSESHLDQWLTDYFEGLIITHVENGQSLITGALPDLPAVYGLILRLRDANISLVSLKIQRE